MSIVKAWDVAYVRFRAPDLTVMRDFLTDFGLVDGRVDADSLHMRGHGDAPFIHATERGAPGFAGFGFCLPSTADVERLAAAEGVAVGDLADPGGGRVVRLTDPDGFTVEAASGQARVETLPVRTETGVWNQAGAYPRQSAFKRIPTWPAHVLRLGHVVLAVSDFRRSERWYKDRFGLVTSDAVEAAPGVVIGAFLRADRGDVPCDHHTLFLLQAPMPPQFMHAAFEVVDLDDLMAGHAHLAERGRDAAWGVGRHIAGSQVFDYWRDPWGHEVEHWTDGDQLVTSDGGRTITVDQLMGVQWGMKMPPHPAAPPR
jgi:catechol 2,3-dioxygenase-like lactoylglutathione lyase family enzyme